MQRARVVGRATSTVKNPTLNGWRLLIVQPLDVNGGPDGFPQLAIDRLGCGRGDDVMISSDGKGVRELVGADNTPARWAVIGLLD
jgi:ethanolamine utilization protein EutN